MTAYWPVKQGIQNESNDIVEVVLPATQGKRLQGIEVIYGYDSVPNTGAQLVITTNGVEIVKVPVVEAGVEYLALTGFTGQLGQDMTATLAAGGISPGGNNIKGYVNLVAREI